MPVDAGWATQWSWQKLPGILLSAMLLSLGAPFWYNALKNLLKLRSSLADKDDEQRNDRQSDATLAPAEMPRTSLAQGESGDLTAVG
jgi:hypothetical protein